MKPQKKPKPSNNHTDKMINSLLCELDKFTHFSKSEIEYYYFTKRLQSYLPIYEKFIHDIAIRVDKASSSYSTLKKINKARLKKKVNSNGNSSN